MLTRDFSLKVKNLDQSGSFTGLVSSYNSIDRGGDLILPGSYRQAIASQGAGYPLLFSHDSSRPLGLSKISDSAAGLLIDGQMMMSDPQVKAVYDHMKFGSIKGLSIGYQIPPDKATYDPQTNIRTIREIRLFECSLVAIPMDPGAMVQSVKSLQQVDQLLRNLKGTDVDVETLASLRSIGGTLKTLLRKDALCECDCPECVADDCENCSNAECVDPNCEGSMAAQAAAEELAALKSFASSLALELKGIV